MPVSPWVLVGRIVGGGWTIALLLVPPIHALEIDPGTDLCAAIHGRSDDEELVLRAGEHAGPCVIRKGGRPDAPLVIRAADPADLPRITYAGARANVIEVRADHVVLRGLAFGPTQRSVDAIRIFARRDVTVEGCEFDDVGGIAIAANNSSVRGLTVRRNVIRRSQSSGMYFGCHDGVACALSNLLIEGNYIHQVRAHGGEVGYGLQVKLNSVAVVRDNVIVDTRGPGIMVYGSHNLATPSLVERNFVMSSQQSSGILLGGGPAIVRNNVAVANEEAGIGLQDYVRRGLLRGIVLAHNTVWGNGDGGIIASPEGFLDATIVNNAAQAASGKRALPAPRPGVRLVGNVDCTWNPCFGDPRTNDFSPVAGSLLVGLGSLIAQPWFPADDYFGARRRATPTVGAIEHPAGPILLGPKP